MSSLASLVSNDEVMWYVATRKGTEAHFLLSEDYIEKYEDEFTKIREFDTIEEAKEAYDARVAADTRQLDRSERRKKIAVSKVRGDIRKGNLDEEKIAQHSEEVIAAATPKPKTAPRGRNSASKPTKATVK